MSRSLLAAALLPLSLSACSDPVKISEDKAQVHVDRLAKLATSDVQEIRTGLPQGAAKLGPLFFDRPDVELVPTHARAVLKKVREQVTVLQLSKSTFFAVTDPAGVAYASDQETDAFVGRNIVTALPGLAKAKDGGVIETTGQMAETRGVRNGDDAVWAAATRVEVPAGTTKALYVTGWSFRRYAEHLEKQLTSDLRNEESKAQKPSKMPLLYVFVVMGDKAYGTPQSPDVNQKAVEGLAIPSKVSGETIWHSHLEITGRDFGVAAKKTPDLCDSCAVAVLRSEI